MKLKANASTTLSSRFDQIGEPLPIKPSDSDSDSDSNSGPIFDLQALPSQPLAVSKLHRLIFVAHSDVSTSPEPKWDAIDSAKNQQMKC